MSTSGMTMPGMLNSKKMTRRTRVSASAQAIRLEITIAGVTFSEPWTQAEWSTAAATDHPRMITRSRRNQVSRRSKVTARRPPRDRRTASCPSS
ncbi:MAG: hypothetical protein E6I22_05740 [Chloroflexi bacterium]|nr:MAG: hypothetical protein E6I22_05740 [Chloroflexota bacterium]